MIVVSPIFCDAVEISDWDTRYLVLDVEMYDHIQMQQSNTDCSVLLTFVENMAVYAKSDNFTSAVV